ncbi:TRAP transporter large permease [Alloalcanivorax mobilis]|uniref:TRAP transporter large permease n=1 Tax=Alloalcanivorax mobilis TaxID=2019569 RepID=UPI000B5B303D|nr:TRAP transporter large permease [Alloalcanivorax mobilis]ASK32907.1 C4-dicarboxylate ABC transporter permease [Alcanivorax sp. N3-2A]ASK36725.1 C4-dicarboxylate ABC transporter permease [Alcanivorax sp. N3-2A]|tara:strand:- start:4138 stop:5478 length:1341 start_codon:yes stop_codon:yes gene_type:complete
MNPQTIGIGVTVLMLGMLLLRVPIAISLVAAGYGGLVLVLAARGGDTLMFENAFNAANSFLGQLAYSSTAEYTFTTIPMFLLMGYLATEGGFTRDIYGTARLWFARVPGGLAVASSVGCALFAAISGSSLATAAAMGRMAVPEMLNWKYDKGLAAGVVAASGTLGSLIPPSILMILYAVFTEQSIAKLFVAGIIPGLLSLFMYVGMVMLRCKLNPALAPPVPQVSFREKVHSLKGTWGMITLIGVIVIGLYTGMFTPSEAGGIGSFGAFLICFLSGRLNRHKTSNAFKETLKNTSMLFAAIIGAYMVTTFTALTGIAGDLTTWAAGFENVPPLVILASLSLLYVFLGTFMGAMEIMLLTLPIVIPIIKGLEYDLIWFGIIMIKYLEIGLVTPPIGINVFIIKAVAGDSIRLGQIFRGVSWFIVMDLITLAILILFPGLALYLPSLM